MFYVLIVASEKSKVEYSIFQNKCANSLKNKVKEDKVTILSLGSTHVQTFCEKYKITYMTIPTKWNEYGREALKYRNENILKCAQAAIIFQDNTKDTSTLIKLLLDHKIPVKIYDSQGNLTK